MDKTVTRIFQLAVLAIIEMVSLAPLHNIWGGGIKTDGRHDM
jgi:hypothetical protein